MQTSAVLQHREQARTAGGWSENYLGYHLYVLFIVGRRNLRNPRNLGGREAMLGQTLVITASQYCQKLLPSFLPRCRVKSLPNQCFLSLPTTRLTSTIVGSKVR